MQVLSDALCRDLEGRAIKHPPLIPARIQRRKTLPPAFARGVKLMGATAHYATAELDEGPIIEQEVIRVGHDYGPAELAIAGQDTERVALSRAVQWHAEQRVLLNGQRIVISN